MAITQITNANILDPEQGEIRADQTVVAEDGIIRSVDHDKDLPIQTFRLMPKDEHSCRGSLTLMFMHF